MHPIRHSTQKYSCKDRQSYQQESSSTYTADRQTLCSGITRQTVVPEPIAIGEMLVLHAEKVPYGPSRYLAGIKGHRLIGVFIEGYYIMIDEVY